MEGGPCAVYITSGQKIKQNHTLYVFSKYSMYIVFHPYFCSNVTWKQHFLQVIYILLIAWALTHGNKDTCLHYKSCFRQKYRKVCVFVMSLRKFGWIRVSLWEQLDNYLIHKNTNRKSQQIYKNVVWLYIFQ